jgi:diguanylate cyclase (GGDEF)-like protein
VARAKFARDGLSGDFANADEWQIVGYFAEAVPDFERTSSTDAVAFIETRIGLMPEKLRRAMIDGLPPQLPNWATILGRLLAEDIKTNNRVYRIFSAERLATIEDISRDIASGVDNANLQLVEVREQASETKADIKWIMAKLADTSAASDRELLTAVRFFGNFEDINPDEAPIFLEDRALELGLLRNTIERQQEIERELSRIAYTDSLTGLSNRRQIERDLSRVLLAAESANCNSAYLMIDLDHFKLVNDTYGHAVGDAVLIEVGCRLIAAVGEEGFCGRIGGDEFVVILPDQEDEQHVKKLGEAIITSIRAPYDKIARWIQIGASIGVSHAPRDGRTSALLTRSADLALLRAKDAGGNILHCYEPRLHEGVDERRMLGQDLEKALELGQLSLVYQPVVCASGEAVYSAEVMLRWMHPRLGYISPATFIPLAEEIGLIADIGNWVIHEAIMQAARWPSLIKVSINLSHIQLHEDLISTVIDALASASLAPERVEFEVTEIAFIYGDEPTKVLAKLRSLGTRLVLDDFGTGYSSLGTLVRAQLSAIKVDRSFVKAAGSGTLEAMATIKAILALADTLKIASVAEGVETTEEARLMRELGFTHLQGYFFSRPMRGEELSALIDGNAIKNSTGLASSG